MKPISLRIYGYPSAHFHEYPKWSSQYNHRAMRVAMSNNQSYWTSINLDIEAHLKHVIPEKEPLSMFQPMSHLVKTAPMDTAPALCIAACELVGGHRNQAMAAAAAIHLMQAALFTHENLPFLERPKHASQETFQHVYKPNIELLVPDAIVPFGCEILAQSNDPAHDKSDLILRMIVEITQAIGSNGMLDGQYHEVTGNQSDEQDVHQMDWAEHVSKKKEGGLHACAAACGAIVGGGNEEEIDKLRKFGLYVGMIKGLSKRVVSNEALTRMVENFQSLAMKEIEALDRGKIDTFSSLLAV